MIAIGDSSARGCVHNRRCPSRRVLNDVTGLWGGMVLAALRDRSFRYAELRRKIDGVSEKMLAQTLRSLERDGLVERLARPVVPPHVEYRLSPVGLDCADRVVALTDWVETHVRDIVRSQIAYDRAREGAHSAATS